MPRRALSKKPGQQRLFRNPLAQAFGLALSDRRRRLRLEVEEDVALKLGVGVTTYRLVEAGLVLIPPYCALAMVHVFGFSWGPLTQTITAMHVLDQDFESVSDMRVRADNLAITEHSLEWIIRGLRFVWPHLEVARGTQRDAHDRIAEILRDTGLVEQLYRFLLGELHPQRDSATDHATVWARRLVTDTPPIYLEIAESIVSQLRKFPPHVNPTTLAEWEKDNSGRIASVYGLVTDHHQLEKAIEFDWAFVTRRERPAKVRIVVPRLGQVDPEPSFQRLLDALHKRNPGRNLSENLMSLEILDEDTWNHSIVPYLRFDFVTRTYPNPETYDLDVRSAINAGRFMTLQNAWLYMLHSPLALSGSDGERLGQNAVAFLDNAEVKPTRPIYAVACSWAHTQRLREILEQVLHES